MKIGFIGVGTITAAVVRGLISAGWEGQEFILSPRNVGTSRLLAAQLEGVSVASSNQEVIDRADVIVLAVRPQVAAAVLSGLSFRQEQTVISFIASLSIEQLKPLVGPAIHILLAAPLPMVELGMGATVVYPQDVITSKIFNSLGRTVAACSHEEFNAFVAATAVMGSYFGLVEAVVEWMGKHSVPAQSANQYLSQMFYGLGNVLNAQHSEGVGDLRKDFSTKGGLNEQLYDALVKDGVLESLSSGLDAIFERISLKSNAS